jgi:hypothetical protein
MKHGAVAIVDALGFKGIWQRHPPDQVLDAMRRLRNYARGAERNLLIPVKDKRVRRKLMLLSDTLVIMCHIDSEGSEPEVIRVANALCAHVVATITAYAISLAANDWGGPRLAFRGCVSVGEFEVGGTTILGPAVDDAAEHHQAAEGALVSFTPNAEKELRPPSRQAESNLRDARSRLLVQPLILTGYPVALKDDVVENRMVVNPFGAGHMTRQEVADVRAGMLGTFAGSKKDVVRKRKNTERFLEEAFAVWERHST